MISHGSMHGFCAERFRGSARAVRALIKPALI
jgi:hypothetical protein